MTSVMKSAVAAGFLMVAASCGAPEDEEVVEPLQAAHHMERCQRGPDDIPPALAVPPRTCLKEKVLGVGVQIYTCAAGAWVSKAPEANLLDKRGRFQGNHFLGPTWQWSDGSKVKAARTAGVNPPDPADIPWLLLGVTSEDGEGALEGVTQVQRVHTRGGQPPAGACTEPAEVRVPYSADYLFYAPAGK